MTAPRPLVAALLVAAALAGCGVPTDDDARRIADRDVPFGLLDPPPPTAATSSTTTLP